MTLQTFKFEMTIDTTSAGGAADTPVILTYEFDSELTGTYYGGWNPSDPLVNGEYSPAAGTLQIGGISIAFTSADIEVGNNTFSSEDSYFITFNAPLSIFGRPASHFEIQIHDPDRDMFSNLDLPLSPDFAQAGNSALLAISFDNYVEGLDSTYFFQNTAFSLIELPAAPSDIAPSNLTVAEHAAAGTVIATLSAIDANAGDTFTYSVTGDTAGRFVIDGDKLKAASVSAFDFERAGTEDVTILVTDQTGRSFEKTFTLAVTDVSPEFVIGGAGNDVLLGGSDGDTYFGLGGDDTLDGRGGNDEIYGGAGADTLRGGSGDDEIYGGAGSDRLRGGEGNDALGGGSGNDVLFGDAGDDDLTGGTGIDTADYSELAGDVVLNLSTAAEQNTGAGGVDSLSGIENAIGGGGNDILTGSALANILTGGGGNDILSGGGGNDTLQGGSGNDSLNGGAGFDTMTGGIGDDVYYVDSAQDQVFELANAGTDWVRSSIGYALNGNVENLALTASADIDGTGNALANSLLGNTGANSLRGLGGNDTLNGGAGADVLDGGTGIDTLTGGTGADTFGFSTALDPLTNRDRIMDFSHADDTICLDSSVFTGLAPGALDADAFYVIGSGLARDAEDRILYNASTGVLLYDADGNGAGAAIAFATLAGAPADVTYADFVLV